MKNLQKNAAPGIQLKEMRTPQALEQFLQIEPIEIKYWDYDPISKELTLKKASQSTESLSREEAKDATEEALKIMKQQKVEKLVIKNQNSFSFKDLKALLKEQPHQLRELNLEQSHVELKLIPNQPFIELLKTYQPEIEVLDLTVAFV